jgi:hypothetical protein
MPSSLTISGIFKISAVATSVLALIVLGHVFLMISWIMWTFIAILFMAYSLRDALRTKALMATEDPETASELQPSD